MFAALVRIPNMLGNASVPPALATHVPPVRLRRFVIWFDVSTPRTPPRASTTPWLSRLPAIVTRPPAPRRIVPVLTKLLLPVS